MVHTQVLDGTGNPSTCIHSQSRTGKGGGILRLLCCCTLRLVEISPAAVLQRRSKIDWELAESGGCMDYPSYPYELGFSGFFDLMHALMGRVSRAWERRPSWFFASSAVHGYHCYIARCICWEFRSFNSGNMKICHSKRDWTILLTAGEPNH